MISIQLYFLCPLGSSINNDSWSKLQGGLFFFPETHVGLYVSKDQKEFKILMLVSESIRFHISQYTVCCLQVTPNCKFKP